MTASDVSRVLDATWRIESGRIIAGVARIVRDVNLAEELAQHALLAALEQWPLRGIPDNPGAWLTTAAKRRAIDLFRHRAMKAAKEPQLVHEAHVGDGGERDLDDDVGDDLLRLIFTACHPVLPADARAALTLRMVGGLSTPEIARAFLVPEATMQQRIVRAKRTLADAHVPFELPRAAERKARLSSVLEVIYLIFNEGYAATQGDDWMRPGLCEDALRLGRITARLMPDEAEVHGLVALMELTASRTKARVTSTGEPVLLLEQNRGLWDRLLIGRGLTALARALALDGAGAYTLQAAIAACHARALKAADTDWARIAAIYLELMLVAPSPVVELNRAVAVAMSEGPAAGLVLVDALVHEQKLAGYHLVPSVRGDFLEKLGRFDEATAEFERALSLTHNAREQALLSARAQACRSRSSAQATR